MHKSLSPPAYNLLVRHKIFYLVRIYDLKNNTWAHNNNNNNFIYP